MRDGRTPFHSIFNIEYHGNTETRSNHKCTSREYKLLTPKNSTKSCFLYKINEKKNESTWQVLHTTLQMYKSLKMIIMTLILHIRKINLGQMLYFTKKKNNLTTSY